MSTAADEIARQGRVLHLLVSTRERLTSPARWLHGHATASALSASGHEVEPQSPLAVCWDLYGALVAAAGNDVDTDAALHAFARAIWPDDAVPTAWEPLFILVSRWHDDPGRKHEDVIRGLDHAIATATEDR